MLLGYFRTASGRGRDERGPQSSASGSGSRCLTTPPPNSVAAPGGPTPCFIRSRGAAGLFYGRRRWSARARKTKKFGISDTTGVVTAVAPSERHFPAILILM